MFTKRIIPCLDVKNGRVVKGVNFVDLKDAGDPVEIAKAYDKAGADEVVFLDITASSDQRGTVIEMAVTYTNLRAHETKANLVCHLLIEKKQYTTLNDVLAVKSKYILLIP